MYRHSTLAKQKGFFDFGLSAIILAISGGVAYVATENHDEVQAEQNKPTQVAVSELPRTQKDCD